jgi:4a-hydroxytetrahydrobiopterin dehydratase
VTTAEIAEPGREGSGWQLLERDGIARLERAFRFPNFTEALAFTNRVGALARRRVTIRPSSPSGGRVTVTCWTHKIRGLHRNDFIMAAKIDGLAAESGQHG